MNNESVQVIPISHASLILRWSGDVLYFDPVGGADAFRGQPEPTVIFVTDIHHDHCEPDTLRALIGKAELVVPQAVKDELPEELAANARVVNNGERIEVRGFAVEAIPMYNVPEKSDTFHPKGRGNGYLIEREGVRVYVAGDTSVTPEMRALQNIDIAFLPMNLPYTMDIQEAAAGVLAFKPKTVYPYHYRGPAGLSDVEQFQRLVRAGDENIEVILANWYGDRP